MTATSVSIPRGARLSFGGLVRSEWIKFTSLRSTYWSSGIILLLWVLLALLLSSVANFSAIDPMTGEDLPATDETRQSATMSAVTSGVMFGMLVAGIQGVLSISGEYSTGMIRSSLAAAPGRLSMYAAKGVVTFVWMFLLGAVSVLAAYLVAMPFLSADDMLAPLGAEELLAMLGAATFLGFVGLFGLGIGTLVRSGAGGIAIVVGVLMVLPMALGIFSIWIDWISDVIPYMFDSAGNAMMTIPGGEATPTPTGMMSTLEPGMATLVALAWTAASLLLGALALKGRDA